LMPLWVQPPLPMLSTGEVRMSTSVAVSWSEPLQDVVDFVPRLLGFVLILVIGWLVARLLRSATDKVLERVGFDRAVDRGGIGRILARTRFDASDLVAKLVYYAIVLFALQLAFGVWGPNPVSDLIASIVAWLPRAAVAIVIVVVAAAIAGGARDLIFGALGGLAYGRLLANLAAAFIVGLGIVAALDQIGIATAVTTPVLIAVLATIAGILVVGVGGGLVRPMQQRWEGWLSRVEAEAPEVSERLRAAAEARRAAAAQQPAEPPESTVAGPDSAGPRSEGPRLEDAPTVVVPVQRKPAEKSAPNRVEAPTTTLPPVPPAKGEGA
jgi:hypothetical protein